jgi:hypothetical protein
VQRSAAAHDVVHRARCNATHPPQLVMAPWQKLWVISHKQPTVQAATYCITRCATLYSIRSSGVHIHTSDRWEAGRYHALCCAKCASLRHGCLPADTNVKLPLSDTNNTCPPDNLQRVLLPGSSSYSSHLAALPASFPRPLAELHLVAGVRYCVRSSLFLILAEFLEMSPPFST